MNTSDSWTSLLNPILEMSPRVIISGDFNARSTRWGDSGNNINGRSLELALPSLKGVIFNNDGPTRLAERPGDTDSCVDLTIASAAAMLEIGWKLLPPLGSDHRPVLITIKHGKGAATKLKPHPGFKYKSRGKGVIPRARNTAKTARKERTKKRSGNSRAWSNPVVEDAWEGKLKAGKDYIKAKKEGQNQVFIEQKRDTFKQATNEYQSAAEEARQEAWTNFCENSDPADTKVISKFWKLAKSMRKATDDSSSGPHQITGLRGEKLVTDEEKGRAFMERFRGQLQMDGKESVEDAWDEINGRMLNSSQGKEPEVTTKEFNTILKQTKKDSSPGPDGVGYSEVLNMTEHEKSEIAGMIEATRTSGKIPEDWSNCAMAVLPKPLKNHAVLKGYRIITMANIWIKLCEKIVAKRLTQDLEDRGCLPKQVGGARPRRSTTANVETVVHNVQQAMQKSEYAAIALYDLEDAYNKVDMKILVRKLEKLEISDIMIRWIVALLGTRRCQMRFRSWRSGIFEVSSGLPQGSPLSPVLFNVYTHDIIENVQDEGTEPFTYVDDIIVQTVDETPTGAIEKQQEASDKLQEWVTENHQSIQSEKSQWMLITRAHVDRSQYTLTYDGGTVPQEDTIVGLGIEMDKYMTMTQHLQRLKQKAEKGLAALKYAAKQRITQHSLLQLMGATVDSRMQYGLHIASATSKTALGKLEQVQNEGLRIVTGAAMPTARDSLRYWLGVRNVKHQQQHQRAREFLRARTTESHPLKQEIDARDDTRVSQRLKTVTSWVTEAREDIENICPTENIINSEWISNSGDNIQTARIGDRSWRERAGIVNEAAVRQWLEEVNPNIIIATDGSIRGDITGWGGAVWKNGEKCYEWATAREGRASSYRSECEAFGDALVWVAENTTKDDRVAVLSDSLSMISRLENELIMKTWNHTLQNVEAKITACYIPGHAGISFNEYADHLAGTAPTFGELQRDPSDVIAEIDRRLQQTEEQEQLSFHSTQRLQERGWHYGEGRGVKLRGRERQIHTQRETGVLTLTTLRSVIEGGGSEQQPAPNDLCCSRIE